MEMHTLLEPSIYFQQLRINKTYLVILPYYSYIAQQFIGIIVLKPPYKSAERFECLILM
jgi:hypothetical protein